MTVAVMIREEPDETSTMGGGSAETGPRETTNIRKIEILAIQRDVIGFLL